MVKQSAQIEYNRTKLAETTLTSPFDGAVIRRSRERGAVVNPGVSIMVNPGVSIMEVAATDEIWGTVWVDETAVSKLKVGQKAQIVFRSQPDQPYAATVRRLPGRAGVRRGGRLMAEANDDRPPMMAWLHAKGRELVVGRDTGKLLLCWTCSCCRPRGIAEFVTNGGGRELPGVGPLALPGRLGRPPRREVASPRCGRGAPQRQKRGMLRGNLQQRRH